MKKFLFGFFGIVAATFSATAIFVFFGEIDAAKPVNYTKNEALKTVKKQWKGTPVDQKDRFVNIEYPFLPSTIGLLKWKLGTNPQEKEKETDPFQLKIQDPSRFLESKEDGIIWLGHASVMIRLEGKVILIDPVFGDPSFIDRYFELPSPLEKIKRVDYVLITHDHRDHMDEPTIRSIAERFPDAKFLLGLGSEDLLKDWVGGETKIQTAGWYQQFSIETKEIKITFIPVRHWSRRGLNDTNERLWGGFIIQCSDKTIYHGGDSGYGSHYAEMADVFPEIDYFIIGIGSYAPRWFMQPNHNDPDDAVKAFIDSKAKFLVPMHYATFNMTDEPPGEPLRRLKENVEKANLSDRLKPLDVYESLIFETRGD
ncbi:MAG: MBL fold metallo-hydrolase [Pyrinomonadaceae bacterium]|nr:MBL fold metallo-hydrolase [Pyrinomonadaceae bacterium]